MRTKIVFQGVTAAELPHVIDTLAPSTASVAVRSFGDFTFEVAMPWSEGHDTGKGPFTAEALTFEELNRRLVQERKRQEAAADA